MPRGRPKGSTVGPRQPTYEEPPIYLNPEAARARQEREELAAKLVRFLGTAQSVEEYVSPSGYRFKKITHHEVVQLIAVNQ